MMSYQDREWCTAVLCPNGKNCDKYVSIAVHHRAVQWWGGPDYPMVVRPQIECDFWDKASNFTNMIKQIPQHKDPTQLELPLED